MADDSARMDQLLAHLDTLTILESLYCMQDEFVLDQTTAALLALHKDGQDLAAASRGVKQLQAVIRMHLAAEQGDSEAHLELEISWRLDGDNPQSLHKRLIHSSWLSRKEFEALEAALQDAIPATDACDDDGDITAITTAVQTASELGSALAASLAAKAAHQSGASAIDAPDSLVRIWMHLPSLSTRSKRQDLVNYAAGYGITGIVHAGKPALIVLEAPTANAVEAYLSFIKRESWADIPSGHKKISEKLREEGLKPHDRVFSDMSEITEEINANGMRGVRGNRGDLGALRDWLTERGLGGDRLAKILGTNWNT